MELKNKIAVISGSSRGIGRAIALALAKEGSKIVINYYKNREKAEETLRSIMELGSEAIIVKADVSDSRQSLELINRAVEAFGNIHILIHNAGIYNKKRILEMSIEEWDHMIKVHLYAAFYLAKYALPYMIKNNEGAIIAISSQIGLRPRAELAHYSSAKAALIAFTKALALELAPYKIRVNSVAPGPIDTDLLRSIYTSEEAIRERGKRVPIGRIGKPEEVADAVLSLIKNDFITGAVLLVDGGSTL